MDATELFHQLPIPCFILRKDRDGYHLTDTNLAAAVFGRGFIDLPDMQAAFKRCHDQNAPVAVEHSLPDPSTGDPRFYAIQISRLKQDGMLVTLYDLGRHIPPEGDLLKAKETAEQALRIKSEFLTHISHQLFPPLNAIIGLGHILGRSRLNQSQQNYLERLNQSSHQLLAQVNDMLDYASILSGQLDLESEEFYLPEVLASAWNLHAPKAEAKGLATELKLDPRLPHVIRGDAKRLHQILVNLLDNAVRHTPSGRISLSARPCRRGGQDVLEFEVADTGTGIAPKRLDRLFQPRLPSESPLNDSTDSAGLGLILCQELVTLQGGSIHVKSMPNQGSCFTIRLPRTPHVNSPAPTLTLPPIPPMLRQSNGMAPAQLPGLRVLVVEDNYLNRFVALETLKQMGITASSAGSGLAALDMFAQDDFDLVLMDIQMPGIDGYETARRIRLTQKGKTVPIIALSAFSTDSDREHGRQAGMSGWLGKPASPDTIEQAIRECLNLQPIATGHPAPVPTQPDHSARPDASPQTALDLQTALDRLGGNHELLTELTEMFIAENREAATTLREFVELRQSEAAVRLVHNLKGGAGNLALAGLFHQIRNLEKALKEINSGANGKNAALDCIDHIETELRNLARKQAGAPEQQPASPGADRMDRAAIAQQLQEVAALLEARNFRAEILCQSLRPAIEADSQLGETSATLFNALANLDFPAAMRATRALLSILG